jgi:hypothetical protein
VLARDGDVPGLCLVGPGVAAVRRRSAVWSCLPEAAKAAVRETVRIASEATSAAAPFAWLRMEPSMADSGAAMAQRLTSGPDASERGLGRAHPHGAKVLWLGARARGLGAGSAQRR